MDLLKKSQYPAYYVKTFIKWAILSVTVGILGGLLGAAFHHAPNAADLSLNSVQSMDQPLIFFF